jgi:hypothetical protein
MKRPGYRIVFKPRDNNPAFRRYYAVDGNIQPMGAVGGHHHPFRRTTEHSSGFLPAGINLPGSLQGCRMATPSRIGTALQGIGYRPVHRLGLVQTGGTIIQVNHL